LQPAQPGATTPADGGANIIGSQASETLVEGGSLRTDPSAEGLAVVEQLPQDELLAVAGSDEMPPPMYDPREVSFSHKQREDSLRETIAYLKQSNWLWAQVAADYGVLSQGELRAFLDGMAESMAELQDELHAARQRIASLEANRSLPLEDGAPVVKECFTTAADILNAAAGHMAARASTYDTPGGERSMGKAVAMFNACVETDLSEAEGWLLLQCLKDVRLFQRPGYHADSAEDCTAYSALKAEAKAREK
jgi:hypothetical protein